VRRRAAAAILLAVLAAAAGCRRGDIKNAYPSGTNVIAFGDSLTQGYGMAPGDTYPAYLAELIGRPVLNKGVSGETTGDALRRLEADVLSQDPRIVLVCLGGNDMLRRLSPDEQFANLRTIVERIQEQGALVVLIGTEGFTLLTNVDYGARYEQLAKETGAVYVSDFLDGVFGDPSLMFDQIHPNAAGYRKVAQRIADEAGEYLER
jgi:lysophospholipase L1-like esterase